MQKFPIDFHSKKISFPPFPPAGDRQPPKGEQTHSEPEYARHAKFGLNRPTVCREIVDLSRVIILTRDIDIANLSVCPFVRLSVHPSVSNIPVSDENGLTYRHSFFSPCGSPIIPVLPASNIFTKVRRGHPLWGR